MPTAGRSTPSTRRRAVPRPTAGRPRCGPSRPGPLAGGHLRARLPGAGGAVRATAPRARRRGLPGRRATVGRGAVPRPRRLRGRPRRGHRLADGRVAGPDQLAARARSTWSAIAASGHSMGGGASAARRGRGPAHPDRGDARGRRDQPERHRGSGPVRRADAAHRRRAGRHRPRRRPPAADVRGARPAPRRSCARSSADRTAASPDPSAAACWSASRGLVCDTGTIPARDAAGDRPCDCSWTGCASTSGVRRSS